MGRTGKVNSLRGLVKDQKMRIAGERAGEQYALKFAAGQFAHLRVDQALRARFRKQAAARSFGTASLKDMNR